MTKTSLRREMLNKRNSLTADFCHMASDIIYTSLVGSNFLNSENILVYSDFKNEVRTDKIINYLFSVGRAVYLPKCNINDKTFTAEIIYPEKTNYQKNIYGISEPVFSEKAAEGKINCAVVPGIAFDITGNRLGFGCGYYDKFFDANPAVLKIALAYDFQVLDFIPHDEYDVQMDIIVTEKRIIVP